MITILLSLAFNAPSSLRAASLSHPHIPPRTSIPQAKVPTLREQMQAYIKSAQERGVELTPEQKAMIAEFEADEEVLEQTGVVDFMKDAEVLTPEEYQGRAGVPVPPAPTSPPPTYMEPPAAPGPDSPGMYTAPIGATAARIWQMQQPEREAAVQLLSKSAVGGGLSESEAAELRRLLASLISTLTS